MLKYCPPPAWLQNLPEISPEISLNIKEQNTAKCNILYNQAYNAVGEKNFLLALDKIRQVIRLNAYLQPAYCLLGDIFYHLEKYSEAEKAYRRAISFDLDNLKTLISFGNLLNHLNRFEEAAEIFSRTLQIDPNIVAGRVNHGLTLMNMGKFKEGWAAYDLRIDHYDKVVGIAEKMPSFNQRWQGENLAGKSILIWSEQGIGDEILFSRFLFSLAKQNPVQIVWATVSNLANLFQGFKTKIPQLLIMSHRGFLNLPESEQKRINYWSALLSLPRFCCNCDAANFPKEIPYLEANPESVQKWKKIINGKNDSPVFSGSVFTPKEKLKVGLVWRGQTVNPIGMYRSVPNGLLDFALLFKLKNIEYYSLQKELSDADKEILPGLAITHLMDEVENMADTAGIIANLDLVITIDTSVAHLAGAMGKACWVIQSGYGAEWRHFDSKMTHEGNDSFWYPGVQRYFRGNRSSKNWEQLIHRVFSALIVHAKIETKNIPYPKTGILAETKVPEIVQRCLEIEKKGDLIAAFNYARDNINLAADDVVLVRLIADYAYSLEWLEQAEIWFNYEFSLENSSVSRMVRFARVYQGLRRNEDAIRLLRYAHYLEPENESVRLCLAEHLLSAGEFAEGWARYLIRHDLTYLPRIPFPKWKGESLNGKSIFLSTEQGMGDEIQFVRYIAELKRVGASKITVMCKQPLLQIFSSVADIDKVVPFQSGTLLDWHDFWSFPLDLPHYLKSSYQNIPAKIPYLSIEQSYRNKWKDFFAKQEDQKNFRLGLVWKGNPLHTNDIRRSLKNFSQFKALWQVQGVSFYSLQKGEAEGEINPRSNDQPITALGHLIDDFCDTAAIVEQLDLVICVDTSVTHLIGALGLPAWVFVPMFEYDWRWGEQCKFTGVNPWYPSIKTINKPAATTWEVVIENLVAPLAKLVHEKFNGKEDEFKPNIANEIITANSPQYLQLSRAKIISFANQQKFSLAAQLCLHLINTVRNNSNIDSYDFILLSQVFYLMGQNRAALDTAQEYIKIVQRQLNINGNSPNNPVKSEFNLLDNLENIPINNLREYALVLFNIKNYDLALAILHYINKTVQDDWQCRSAYLMCQYYLNDFTDILKQQYTKFIKLKTNAFKSNNSIPEISLPLKKTFNKFRRSRNCIITRCDFASDFQQICENINAAKYLLNEWSFVVYCSSSIENAQVISLIQLGATVIRFDANSQNSLAGEFKSLDNPNIDFFFFLDNQIKLDLKFANLIAKGVANHAKFFVIRRAEQLALCPYGSWGGQTEIIKNVNHLLANFASTNILSKENLQFFLDNCIWQQIASSVWISEINN